MCKIEILAADDKVSLTTDKDMSIYEVLGILHFVERKLFADTALFHRRRATKKSGVVDNSLQQPHAVRADSATERQR